MPSLKQHFLHVFRLQSKLTARITIGWGISSMNAVMWILRLQKNLENFIRSTENTLRRTGSLQDRMVISTQHWKMQAFLSVRPIKAHLFMV